MAWQPTTSSLFERTSYLLRTGEFSDVTFVVGREPHRKSFPVHKVFLAMASDVFATMFYGPLAEKRNEIEMSNEDPDVFEAILNYIYSDLWELSSAERALQVYRVADIYNILHLKEQCKHYIQDYLDPSMACYAYEVATVLNDAELKNISWQMIVKETSAALQADNLAGVTESTVMDIVKHGQLNISEVELFEGVVSWAKGLCQAKSGDAERTADDVTPSEVRSVIEDILPHIRFLSMPAEDFTNFPAKSGILTPEESFTILASIIVPDSSNIPEWCTTNRSARNGKIREPSSPSQLLLTTRCTNWFSITEQLRPICIKFKVLGRDIHLLGGSFFLQSRSSRYSTVSFHFKVCIGEEPERLVSVSQYEHFSISGRANHRLMLTQSVYLTDGDVCWIEVTFTSNDAPSWSYVQCVGSLIPVVVQAGDAEFEMIPIEGPSSHFHEILFSVA